MSETCFQCTHYSRSCSRCQYPWAGNSETRKSRNTRPILAFLGLYNLASGGALLLASATAGWMWDRHGPASSFVVGAALACAAALVLLLRRAATARR